MAWLGAFFALVGFAFLMLQIGGLLSTGSVPVPWGKENPGQDILSAASTIPLMPIALGIGLLFLSRRRRIEIDDQAIRVINSWGRVEGSVRWSDLLEFRFAAFGTAENFVSGGIWKLEGNKKEVFLSDESPDWPSICDEIEKHASQVDGIKTACRAARMKHYPQ